eukprot:CAMPEP_0171717520 /NCGR_PEP_ID=MMETSP0991-20121206/20074_1 /TAXON_ID=483369 /ORGANISM="non described non described, Strain CCMP2098" /LENGTH=711 /DNA_ID=CAMNT_0012308737 /DNA_START=51 /DNA_END=2187 /DNA_ORIENTATION=-
MVDPSQIPQVTWATQAYGLDKRLVKACKKAGWVSPTLVQQHAIPLFLKGKDVLCRARTGAGKTAAYLLPLLQKILGRKADINGADRPAVRALILVPTNELCHQVTRQLEELSYYCSEVISALSLASSSSVAGGGQKATQSKSAAIQAQAVLLRSCPDVVVATPTRANLHLQSGSLVFEGGSLETLVVDEADLVLSFGHGDDMRAIAAALPDGAQGVQGILMSATLSPALLELKRLVLHSPAIIKLNDEVGAGGEGKLLQFYVNIASSDKFLLLYVFLRLGMLQGKGIVFVNSIDEAYRVRLFLSKFGIRSAALNSELPLTSRTSILDEFNRGIFDLLVATDEGFSAAVLDSSDDDEDDEEEDEDDCDEENEEEDVKSAKSSDEVGVGSKEPKTKGGGGGGGVDDEDQYGVARGVDFKGVTFVVNMSMPRSADAGHSPGWPHCKGGASGTAITLVDPSSAAELTLLAEVQTQQPPLPVMTGDSALAVMGPAAVGSDRGSLSHAQPAPLSFDLHELESFRYRVEDTLRSVTKGAVREERAAELKREVLNSERLTEYFALNPNDHKTLRHDKRAVPSQQQDTLHLEKVPDYLVPRSLRAIGGDGASNTWGRKRRRNAKSMGGADPRRNKAFDPLQSYSDSGQAAGATADGVPPNKEGQSSERIYTKFDDTGEATAGRRVWKMRHRKGEFSEKTSYTKSKHGDGGGKKGGAKKRK